jgi:hypothetical protein
MSEEHERKHSTYTPSPPVPEELAPRLAVILSVLSGEKSVSEAARQLNLSRNHFQSLLHRSLGAVIETLAPREPGRPPPNEALSDLQRQLKRLERENTRLKRRVEATNELITVAGELLHGQRRPGERQRRRRKPGDTAGSDSDSEPEPHVALVRAVQRMHALGLTLARAAWLAGVASCTERRWRRHPCVRSRAHQRLAPEVRTHAESVIRELHGLIGAAALSHDIEGLSRRTAARIKSDTLRALERERQAALKRLSVSHAGVMRSIDAMHLKTSDGPRYALIAADAAVPYRTCVAVAERYDAKLVVRLLEQDIAQNGAPLVLRADRARAHDAPPVREILAQHHVLMLHGPPRYPCFYGQLERQNREHRAWLTALNDPDGPPMQELLEKMLHCLNSLWPRRRLAWSTAAVIWSAREPISTKTRYTFEEEVHDRTQRMACQLKSRGKPADLAERLAIEQTLTRMGYLQQQVGRQVLSDYRDRTSLK